MYRRIIISALSAITFFGCAGLPADSFGNEGRPFGTDESYSAYRIEYTAESREALIVYCHDQRGTVSRDGLNCVFAVNPVNWYTYTPPCVVATVKDAPRDEGWISAVCRGWRPAGA